MSQPPAMLRATPHPISEVCLSIDVGSINAGICLFDGPPAAQNIMYLARRQLLDVHAAVVHDYEAVKRHLDAITYEVQTLLQGRPYWVLVEQQYFDAESKAGLIFNLQLEACVAMYYRAHNIPVRLIQATKRFPFLGLDGWTKNTRYERKKRVANTVKDLLDPQSIANAFALRAHNLAEWAGRPTPELFDMADAVAQCLVWYYRNMQAVKECTVAAPAASTDAAAAGPRNAGTTFNTQRTAGRRPQPKDKPTLVAVKGKLERTLAQLGIVYGDLIRGESTASKKLYRVWQHNPQDPHLTSFLQLLHDHNSRGSAVSHESELEERLTPLLT